MIYKDPQKLKALVTPGRSARRQQPE